MASILIILFPFFLYVWCIHVCVHISHVCGHTHRHMQAGAWCLGSFSCSHPLVPEAGSLKENQSLKIWLVSLATSRIPFPPRGLEFQEGCYAYPAMTWVSENLNSGPHVLSAHGWAFPQVLIIIFFNRALSWESERCGEFWGLLRFSCAIFIVHIFCSFFKWQI